MKIEISNKFKDTPLVTLFSKSDDQALAHILNCWTKLCSIYGFTAEELAMHSAGNPWAELCREIVNDVFPGFSIAHTSGKKKESPDEYHLYISQAYELAKRKYKLSQDVLYNELIKYEHARYGRKATWNSIHNSVNKGKIIREKIAKDYALADTFISSFYLPNSQYHDAVAGFLDQLDSVSEPRKSRPRKT